MAHALAVEPADYTLRLEANLAELDKLEALAEDYQKALAYYRSNRLVLLAMRAWQRGNASRTARLALEATKADEENAKAYHMLAQALHRMGFKYKALVTFQRAFELDPNDPDLLVDLGLFAWSQKLGEEALKMFRLYIAACPDSPIGYNNLGSILGELGRQPEAIDVLRAAIMKMPRESILWHSLATVLAEDGRIDESLVFYREALDIDRAASYEHNLGYAYLHLGMLNEALECYDHALTELRDPRDRVEANYSRSISLIGLGRLEEGFAEYEVRNEPMSRSHVPHVIPAKPWQGEPLEGKRLVVIAEQGLGDEIMFANTLPDLEAAVGQEGKLFIAVDNRLIPLFARSFPEAEIGYTEDRVHYDVDGNTVFRFVPFAEKAGNLDYYTLMGSVPRFLRRHIEDFPHWAYLKPDPVRVAEFRRLLEGPKMTVGLCWRSMKLDLKRAKYYSTLEQWGPILKVPGVRFVNLQYGDCAEEIRRAEDLHGVKIEVVDGLDLKNDIDGLAALSAALDLVISAPTASAATAASVGAEVWFLSANRTWPQLGTDEYPWYRKTAAFHPERFGDWNEVIPRLAGELFARSASR